MENVDKIIYINLDRRVDRRAEIEAEFERIGLPKEKIIRFPAISHAKPNAGCNLSHAGALKLAAALGLKNCLILEDDFNFVEDAGYVEAKLADFFASVSTSDWDVVQLAHYVYEGRAHNNTLGIAVRTSNAAGYLVNSHMFETLAATIGAAAGPLETTGAHWLYQNDVVWCKHMNPSGRWFYFLEPLGYQRTSFSNLAGQVVTHKRKLG